MFKDYYAILQVANTASPQEIRESYVKLAQRYHPDKHQGNPLAEERFRDIGDAYATLSAPTRRHEYDQQRRVHYEQELSAMGGGGQPQAQPRPYSGPWVGAPVNMPRFDKDGNALPSAMPSPASGFAQAPVGQAASGFSHQQMASLPRVALPPPTNLAMPAQLSRLPLPRATLLVSAGLIIMLIGAFLPWATVTNVGLPRIYVQGLGLPDGIIRWVIGLLMAVPAIHLIANPQAWISRITALIMAIAAVFWSVAAFIPPDLAVELGRLSDGATVQQGSGAVVTLIGAVVLVVGVLRLPLD